ncbi:Nucleic acid-binding, OB-fold-like protein [Cordyceps fumosorosea ARSEF 2679]|uniref:Nucleic acid-binding, OB-fold-like protein n=1 Tax=Cordyceps fumosorosea (strain ARSEF 2679) TaxID=1081104 RepID=A0A167S732_CORFA|nr:Nucleic acid-binding, OB-fold-like protein [Cordyceps fumosorosea ARSEF 2679]OAA59325.1 Nucleic acid-binding, OB-fold-like protein [Cordyceps fumosorosea ARSEF 2679]
MGRPNRTAAQAAADETLVPPAVLAPNQTLVRVVRPEGSNLFLCALPGAGGQARETILLELAQRFRNTVWLRRGGFALAERYEEGAADTRAQGEIINVVRGEKDWRKMPYWPKEFAMAVYDDEDDQESTVGKMPPSDSEDE